MCIQEERKKRTTHFLFDFPEYAATFVSTTSTKICYCRKQIRILLDVLQNQLPSNIEPWSSNASDIKDMRINASSVQFLKDYK